MVRASGTIRRILIDAGLITAEDWTRAREGGGGVLDALVAQGVIQEPPLLATLSKAARVVPVDLHRAVPDPKAVQSLPQEVCLEHLVLPLARNGEVLTIAVSDPFDIMLLDDLNILAEAKIRPVLSLPGQIKTKLSEVYDQDKKQVDELLGEVNSADLEVAQEEASEDLAFATAEGEDVPAVKLVNLVLTRALRDKASDIHIEPTDKNLRIRFRIDGRLIEIMTPPKSLGPSVMSRLKILASLDIAIRFEPQDGKFQIRFEGRTIDFRLSMLPVVGGEKAVMRILDQSGVASKLDTLGFEDRCLKDMLEAVSSAYGMVLVTGPTGSGKSTTLYASVREVATPEINVVTVEDPVEYRMDGVNQVPVNPKRGLTFAGALRSILRQDPDVVLVGEMRDLETIEAALTLAETGHLTFATLHTSDVQQTVNRIVDVFPAHQQQQIRTMLSFTLQAVVCQQLVAKQHGKGRVLAAEVMVANPAIRALIRDNKAHQIMSIIQTGGAAGMKTMNQSLFELYRAGTISYEDALDSTTDVADFERLMERHGAGGATGRRAR